MKVLIAGGCGFIGRHLCEYYADRGHEVHVVDDLTSGKRTNLPYNKPNIKFHFGDVSNLYLPIKFDYVYHLASPASPIFYWKDPVKTIRANVLGTQNLLDIAKFGDAKFLFASTSEVYGDPEMDIQSETYFGNVNPYGVRACYDEGKRCGEAMVYSYQDKVQTHIARIFNTYGDYMRVDDGRIVTECIKHALRKDPIHIYGDGSNTRSYSFVTDTVRGLINLINSEYSSPVNIGNPDEFYSNLEVAKLVLELTNSDCDIIFDESREDDPKRRRPDISLAMGLLDWKPTVSMREGLPVLIDFMKKRISLVK